MMNLLDREKLIDLLHHYVRIGGLEKYELPEFDVSNYVGAPFVICHERHYEYVIQEGNTELRRENYSSSHKLLYAILVDITREAASDYELDNRKAEEDSRAVRFHKQIEIMTSIKEEWGFNLEKT